MTGPELLSPTDPTALDLELVPVAAEWSEVVIAQVWEPISILNHRPQRLRSVIGDGCCQLLAHAARDSLRDEIMAEHVGQRKTIRVVQGDAA